MTSIAPPRIGTCGNAFVTELSTDYSHLYEPMLEDLAVLPLLAASIEPPRLVIDMSNVQFIGSAAIGYFVTVAKTLNKRGGWLKLANPGQFCRAAIGLSNLDIVMPCTDSVETAVGEV